MAYTDFSLDDLEQTFGIQNRTKLLFEKPNIQKPSKKLTDYLDEIADLPVRTISIDPPYSTTSNSDSGYSSDIISTCLIVAW